MKRKSFLLHSLQKNEPTHQILSYLDLVRLWNVKENSMWTPDISSNGLKKSTPICALCLSSKKDVTRSEKEVLPPTWTGPLKMDLKHMTGKPTKKQSKKSKKKTKRKQRPYESNDIN